MRGGTQSKGVYYKKIDLYYVAFIAETARALRLSSFFFFRGLLGGFSGGFGDFLVRFLGAFPASAGIHWQKCKNAYKIWNECKIKSILLDNSF